MAETRVKKTICQNFQEKGECKFGESCHFAHGEEELGKLQVNPDSRFKKTLCIFYAAKGFCKFGETCHFAHGESEIGTTPPSAEATDMGGAGQTMQGTCKDWLDEKGFGFIKPDVPLKGGDVFVFRKELDSVQSLMKGERVFFEMVYDEKRQKYKATRCWREDVADRRPAPGGTETAASQAEMQAAIMAHYGHLFQTEYGQVDADQVMQQYAQLQQLQQAQLQQQQQMQQAQLQQQMLQADPLAIEGLPPPPGYGAIGHGSQSSHNRSSPYPVPLVAVGSQSGAADAGGSSVRVTAADLKDKSTVPDWIKNHPKFESRSTATDAGASSVRVTAADAHSQNFARQAAAQLLGKIPSAALGPRSAREKSWG